MSNTTDSVIVYGSRSERMIDQALWDNGLGADLFVFVVAMLVGAISVGAWTWLLTTLFKPKGWNQRNNVSSAALALGLLTAIAVGWKMWL